MRNQWPGKKRRRRNRWAEHPLTGSAYYYAVDFNSRLAYSYVALLYIVYKQWLMAVGCYRLSLRRDLMLTGVDGVDGRTGSRERRGKPECVAGCAVCVWRSLIATSDSSS